MITNFSINNFRIFKDKTDFEISPITILTGPNNSGKSTFIRALRLLIESAKSSSLLYLLKSSSETDYLSYNDIFGKSQSKDKVEFQFQLPLTISRNYNEYDGSGIDVYSKFKISLEYIKFNQNESPNLILSLLNIDTEDGTSLFKIHLSKKHLHNEELEGNVETSEYKFQANIDMFFDLFFNKVVEKQGLVFLFKRFFLGADLENSILLKIKDTFEGMVYSPINHMEYANARNQNDLVNTLIEIQSTLYRNCMPAKSINGVASSIHDTLERVFIKHLNEDFVIIDHEEDKAILANSMSSVCEQLFDEFDKFCKLILSNLNRSLLSFDHYISAFRGKMLREFGRNDSERINKTIFKLLDCNRKICNNYAIRYNGRIIELGSGPNLNFVNAMLKAVFKIDLVLHIKYEVSKQKHEVLLDDGTDFIVNKGATETDENGNIVLSELVFNNDGRNLTNLIDMGSGMYHLILFLIEIELAIIDGGYNYYKSKMIEVENRLNVENHFEKKDGKSTHTIIIEEPELSLHPNYQSLLADVIEYAYSFFGVKFIIETHSEYLIRKLQLLRAKGYFNQDSVLIYNMNRPNSTNPNSLIKKIRINADGSLTQDFGSGFVDEATKTIFELWKVHSKN
jgi:AAA15 family ATPase/GTPase